MISIVGSLFALGVAMLFGGMLRIGGSFSDRGDYAIIGLGAACIVLSVAMMGRGVG